MSVFEFKKKTQRRSEVISEELVRVKKILSDKKAGIQPKEDRIKWLAQEIERIRIEAQNQMNKLAAERADLETQVWDARLEIKRIGKEIADLEAKLRLAIDSEIRMEKFREQSMRFDEITAGLYWREWALGHQIDGARWIANGHRVILADDMGLGKTLTSLMACDMMESQRILIIAPSDVVKNFEREVRRWAPHRTTVLALYRMTRQERDAAFQLFRLVPNAPYVILTNYEAWRKDTTVIDKLIELRFDTVILDEVHNVKETSTAAYKGVNKIIFAENSCPRCSGIVEEQTVNKFQHYFTCTNCGIDSRKLKWGEYDRCSVKNVISMSGTPILNRPDELFPALHFMLPTVFHDLEIFRSLYCIQDYETGKWKFRPGALERLKSHLEGRYIARRREDAGVKIPKQDIVYHEIDPSDIEESYPLQWRIIQQLTKHAQIVLDSGDTITPLAAITVILRKRQANVYPGGINLKDSKGNVVFSVEQQVSESIKLDRAFDLLTEICQDGLEIGKAAVVFSQFKPGLHRLSERLNQAGISSVVFDGDTPEAVREQIKSDFDRNNAGEKKWQVVLANYRTGGVGLNFTRATHLVALDEEWNPGKNEQAYARINRVGQTEETTVHVLRIARSIDTWMADLISQKAAIVGGLEVTGRDLLQAMNSGEMI